jgi:protocatechuate 3,4-dioxygenase beta subunit
MAGRNAAPGEGNRAGKTGPEAAGDIAAGEAGDAASGPPSDDPDLPVSIEGRVTDPDGNPVAGAKVAAVSRKALTEAIEKDAKGLDREALRALRAFRKSLDEVAGRLPWRRTGADGSYALRGLPDGDHRVIVEHPDFLPHGGQGWILVEAGRKVRYDVELTPGQTISGRVRDSMGEPIAGARVSAAPVETARLKGIGKVVQVFIGQVDGTSLIERKPAVSDARGAFRLTSLEPGAYDLRAVKEGHAWGEVRAVPSGSVDVTVTLGPALRVSGRVVSPAAEPVASASIVLRDPERDIQGPEGPLAVAYVDVDVFGEKGRSAASDAEGRFSLDAFTSGAYDLIVRAEGFPEHRRSISIEGEGIDLGDIVLAESRAIAGMVLSPDGGPVIGAAVWVPEPSVRKEDRDSRRRAVLEAGPSSSIAGSRTDGQGAFRLSGLGGGAHEVAVLAEGHPGELLEGVAAGETGLAIVLKPGVTIRGRVVEAESGAPVPGARVEVEGGRGGKATADSEGRFELRGVGLGDGAAAESIVVRASLEGYREGRETVAVPDPLAAPWAEVEIEMRRLGKEDAQAGISGLVRDARGRPIANAQVWAEVSGLPSAFLRVMAPDKIKDARTDVDGTFTLPDPRFGQRFEVVAAHPGLATSRVGPFPPDGEEGKRPFVEIVLGEGASIEGRVAGPGGAISGARIRIWRDAQVPEEATLFTRLLPPSEGESTYSGQDGAYSLRKIEPGSYRVEARAQGYATKAFGPVEVRAASENPAADPAATGAGVTRIDIVLEKGGSLAGRVVDLRGEPLPGIEVVAFPLAAGPSTPPGEEEDEIVQMGALGAGAATTGADGAYEIDHLPDGDYRVLARAKGYEPASIPRAARGDPLPDLVLSPYGRIAGRVRDEVTGAPVGSFAVKLDRKDAGGQFREEHRKSRDVESPQGRFASDGLRAGEWRVRVLARDHTAWEKDVRLEPGGKIDLEAVLRWGCRILGFVKAPDGAPITGATIGGRPEGDWWDRASTRSGEDGSYVLAGLEAGSYLIRAEHPDHFVSVVEGSTKVEISPEEDVSASFVMRPAGRIQGRIRGVTFSPPGSDQWIVTFSPVAGASPAGASRRSGEAPGPDTAPQPFWLWTDESGNFLRDGVRPGKYRLALVHKRRTPETGGDWIDVPPGSHPLGNIEVRAGEMASFNGEAP